MKPRIGLSSSTIITISIQILLILSFTQTALCASSQGVQYSILHKSNNRHTGCQLHVRLGLKVSTIALRNISEELKQTEVPACKRLGILYYLGTTPYGNGAWATANFNPNLEVKILGTTIEIEKATVNASRHSATSTIGVWWDDYIGREVTLIKKNEEVVLHSYYSDGSSGDDAMTQVRKDRFRETKRNSFGEYYQIDSEGNLAVYDRAGLVYTMRLLRR